MLKRSRSSLQRLDIEFFLLVRHHLALGALAEAEALDGLGQDQGRHALGPHCGGIGRIDLVRSCPPRLSRQMSSSDMLATIS